MKKILMVLPLVLLLTVGCQKANNNNNQAANQAVNTITNTNTSPITSPSANSTNNPVTNQVTNPTGQKFSDSADYQNAYLISTDNLSQGAQQALTGFKLTKKILTNGSIQVNLQATESGYQDQQYTLQPGQQLYFVDRNLGDDINRESNQRDDYGVIVDDQGYIVNSSK